eukprot:m.28694 g.28694  ORF g.28694 m.28694 type:complete len:320 (-) comp8025_c0_seq2:40-999(-)
MPVCLRCGTAITAGKVVKHQNNVFHPECFCCAGPCKKSLGDRKFFVVANEAWCPDCFAAKKADTCARCGNTICHMIGHKDKKSFKSSQEVLKFGGMLFHKKCFTCEQCGTKLNGKRANQIPVTHGNSVLCRKHANEREKRLSLEISQDICQACNKAVSEKVIKVDNTCWHPQCFVCKKCKKSLEKIQFKVENNELFCNECSLHGTCSVCNCTFESNPDGITEFVKTKNGRYHPDCYICQDPGCGLNLLGPNIRGYHVQGKLYCAKHKNRDRDKDILLNEKYPDFDSSGMGDSELYDAFGPTSSAGNNYDSLQQILKQPN